MHPDNLLASCPEYIMRRKVVTLFCLDRGFERARYRIDYLLSLGRRFGRAADRDFRGL